MTYSMTPNTFKSPGSRIGLVLVAKRSVLDAVILKFVLFSGQLDLTTTLCKL